MKTFNEFLTEAKEVDYDGVLLKDLEKLLDKYLNDKIKTNEEFDDAFSAVLSLMHMAFKVGMKMQSVGYVEVTPVLAKAEKTLKSDFRVFDQVKNSPGGLKFQ